MTTSVFTRAAAAIFADTNLSEAASYRVAGRGAPTDVRIIRTLATDLVNSGGRQFRVPEGKTISVLATDSVPSVGDTWTLATGVILTAVDVERSVEGDSYTVTVR